MKPEVEARSALIRFFDTFFQERSIQWMIGVGMAILLGSSLMLVTTHWNSYTPVWKYLILLGYTAGIHAAGQVGYHSLGLRKTGTGLMALTVLLIPLTFLSLRWIHAEEAFSLAALVEQTGLLALLGVNAVFAVFAALRIFRHFLVRTQSTFVGSYVLLSFAGAILSSLPETAALWASFVLWAVFAAGSMKVNRHVFWLTEEHRRARIYGFFPILLLGGQFLLLFATSLAPHVPLEWMGLGAVLTAIPVLFAADSLARVFLEVQGQVVRPLPWSIGLPMFIGLTLTAGGVCLAGLRFPDAGVLVPTAGLAAVVMAVVARRTNRAAFVWAMLIGLLLAYQCSPVFFREFARQVVHQGAAAVRESRLPIAFYGLTYFPLLAVTSLWAAWDSRRGNVLFAAPLKQFSMGVGVLLLAASLSHSKAIFPVNLALTALFALQAGIFRSRAALWWGALAWCLAAFGFTPFAQGVLSLPATDELSLLVWGLTSGLLLLAGAVADDRTVRWLAEEDRRGAFPICRTVSLVAVLLIAGSWLVEVFYDGGTGVAQISGGLLTVLLLTQAILWRKPALCDVALGFGVIGATLLAQGAGWTLTESLTLTVGLLGSLWLAAPVLRRDDRFGISDLFARSSERVSSVGFITVLFLFLVPSWFSALVSGETFTAWMVAGVATAWTFSAARRLQAPWLTWVGWIGLLGTQGSGLLVWSTFPGANRWLATLWGATALALIPFVSGQRSVAVNPSGDVASSRRRSVIAAPLRTCVLITMALIAVASLLSFTTPIRVAGGISLAGLLLLAALEQDSALRTPALMLANWQILCAVFQCCVPNVKGWEQMTFAVFAPAALPVAVTAVLQALFWNREPKHTPGELWELATFQSVSLQSAGAAALLASLTLRAEGLSAIHAAMAVTAFVALAANQILTALRQTADDAGADELAPLTIHEMESRTATKRAAEGHVWAAEALVAAGVAYLAIFGVISFGHGASLFVVLGAGILAWVIAQATAESPRTAAFSRPLSITGMWLPAVAVLIGVSRHFLAAEPAWLGANSLALLMAAGFYFWRGIEREDSGLVVAAAVILNVALALLWQELRWFDPQFFMIPLGVSILVLVELLRREIPEHAHNPLRYVGALVILVSPTFHIVEGSWLHLLSLLIVSVLVTLVSMGLRVRALMYMGTAFLVADLIAMVVRGSVDDPSILWIAGIAVGCAVIGLAAYCEGHREGMLQRLRMIAAELETWR